MFATVDEIAATEKINASYVSRVLRLTLLAPDIVKAILDGRQSTDIELARLLRGFSSSGTRADNPSPARAPARRLLDP